MINKDLIHDMEIMKDHPGITGVQNKNQEIAFEEIGKF